jgi:hypothetical protein
MDELERVKRRAEPAFSAAAAGRSLLSSKVTLALSRVLWERKRGRDSPVRDMVLSFYYQRGCRKIHFLEQGRSAQRRKCHHGAKFSTSRDSQEFCDGVSGRA